MVVRKCFAVISSVPKAWNNHRPFVTLKIFFLVTHYFLFLLSNKYVTIFGMPINQSFCLGVWFCLFLLYSLSFFSNGD